jgi:hypothetical protein
MPIQGQLQKVLKPSALPPTGMDTSALVVVDKMPEW